MSKKEKKEEKISLRQRLGVLGYYLAMAYREKPTAVFWYAFGIIPTSVEPFITIIFPKLIIDELVGGRRIPYLILWVALLAGLRTFVRYVDRFVFYKKTMASEYFYLFMERQFSEKIMRVKFACTENPKDMDQSQKSLNGYYYSGGIPTLLDELTTVIASVFTMAGVVGIIFTASPLLLVLAVLVVVASLILKAKEIGVRIHFYNLRPKLDRIYQYVFRDLGDFAYGKDLRLYGGHDMIREMGADTTKQLYRNDQDSADKRQKFDLITGVVNTVKNGLTYGYLGILAILGRITVGDFNMLMDSADTFTGQMLGFINNLQELGNDLQLMNEYRVFIEYPEEKDEGGGRRIDEESRKAPVIEFKNVTFRYPGTDRDILRHVNLTIDPREHICLVGENGAGKTTFIKLLCRLYPVTEGDILLNGVSIYHYSQQEYRKLLSVVFQDFKLFSFSIRENLKLAGNGTLTDGQLKEICALAGFGERLEGLPKGLDTGLYKQFYEDGIEPSGGEAQKLAIARALCKEAPVVVLDEPTAALDPYAEAEIYEHFQEMSKDRTAVFISHRLSSCQFCDRVIVFAKQGIAESGTHKELLEKGGLYAQMFYAQAKNYRQG